MGNDTMRQLIITIVLGGILLTGCINPNNPQAQSSLLESQTPNQPEAVLTATQTEVDFSPTPSPNPTETPSPSPTVPSPTPTLTPTPQWVFNQPGTIHAPILLYHHVQGEVSTNRYEVSLPDFRAQMLALKEMGYTPIAISLFLQALNYGAELPEKPIVITFDDGHQSVYLNAFPIMQELGFPGVFYIVANRINGAPEFVDKTQLKEMIAAGWEIGSHSYSHVDLTLDHSLAEKEIRQSKLDLEAELDTSVLTFAYPYGTIDPFLAQRVSDYGYQAGMGLGKASTHTWNTLFYLDRIEIRGTYTLEDFYQLLTSE